MILALKYYRVIFLNYNGPGHNVGFSCYPFLLRLVLSYMVTSVLFWFKFNYNFYLFFGFLVFLIVMGFWSKDIFLEGISGNHHFNVQDGFKVSFLLFIFREVIFFFRVFWMFFDASLSPSMEVGHVWPPFGVLPPNYLGIPLLGTVVLLRRGVTVSWFHSLLISNKKSNFPLLITVILSLFFLCLQIFEYFESRVSISDGIFGSVFYFGTGFHGFHVFLGGLLLFFGYLRLVFNHFSSIHHVGLEISIFYWHFVDVVWIFLYLFFYCWGR